MRVPRPLLLPAALLLAAAACGGSGPVKALSPTPSPTPKASPSPSLSGAPSPGGPLLADGRHFGFIQSVDLEGSPPTIVVDLADLFIGEDATEAAREDGVIGADETLPNDLYIRNQNPLLRTLALAQGVDLVVVDWTNCCDAVKGDLQRFAAAFERPDPTGAYRGSDSPYWFTVSGGRVTTVEEQYVA